MGLLQKGIAFVSLQSFASISWGVALRPYLFANLITSGQSCINSCTLDRPDTKVSNPAVSFEAALTNGWARRPLSVTSNKEKSTPLARPFRDASRNRIAPSTKLPTRADRVEPRTHRR